jgi:hypothetical protein
MNIYAIIGICCFVSYAFVLYKTSVELTDLRAETTVPTNMIGGINIKQLKVLYEQSDDILIKAKHLIFLINVNKCIVYGVLAIYIILMIIGV